jgi:TP901-1 family phage major tail protein
MATVGVVNGHYLRFFDSGTAIAKATECSISWSVEMRETAHKDTAGDGGGWREVSPGQKSGTGSTSGLYAEDTNSFATLYDKMIAGTALELTFTTGETGDNVYYGQAFINSMELNAPNNENVSYTISFEFNGEIVRS